MTRTRCASPGSRDRRAQALCAGARPARGPGRAAALLRSRRARRVERPLTGERLVRRLVGGRGSGRWRGPRRSASDACRPRHRPAFRFDEAEFRERRASACTAGSGRRGRPRLHAARGDDDLNPHLRPAADVPARPKPAAVLVPIVKREPEAHACCSPSAPSTCRAMPGRSHFRAARSMRAIRSAVDAALREAKEETGLEPASVEVGRLSRRLSRPAPASGWCRWWAGRPGSMLFSRIPTRSPTSSRCRSPS